MTKSKFNAIVICISFAAVMAMCVGGFFTVFNLIGIMSNRGVGDWASFFFWSMITGFIVFPLTYVNKCVRDFWKKF